MDGNLIGPSPLDGREKKRWWAWWLKLFELSVKSRTPVAEKIYTLPSWEWNYQDEKRLRYLDFICCLVMWVVFALVCAFLKGMKSLCLLDSKEICEELLCWWDQKWESSWDRKTLSWRLCCMESLENSLACFERIELWAKKQKMWGNEEEHSK